MISRESPLIIILSLFLTFRCLTIYVCDISTIAHSGILQYDVSIKDLQNLQGLRLTTQEFVHQICVIACKGPRSIRYLVLASFAPAFILSMPYCCGCMNGRDVASRPRAWYAAVKLEHAQVHICPAHTCFP